MSRNVTFILFTNTLNLSLLSTDVGQWQLTRTKEERDIHCKGDKAYGYFRQLLSDLDQSCCPPDLLHLKKGVISKLLNNVIIHRFYF